MAEKHKRNVLKRYPSIVVGIFFFLLGGGVFFAWERFSVFRENQQSSDAVVVDVLQSAQALSSLASENTLQQNQTKIQEAILDAADRLEHVLDVEKKYALREAFQEELLSQGTKAFSFIEEREDQKQALVRVEITQWVATGGKSVHNVLFRLTKRKGNWYIVEISADKT